MSPPVLAYADFTKTLHTPHRRKYHRTWRCAIPTWRQWQGKSHTYASRSVTKSERNAPAHKLEFLALKWAVTDKFHDYLYGNKVQVLTDKQPPDLCDLDCKARCDRTKVAAAALANYDISIKYRTGKTNIDADLLSRRHTNDSERCSDVSESANQIQSDAFEAICHYAITCEHWRWPICRSSCPCG